MRSRHFVRRPSATLTSATFLAVGAAVALTTFITAQQSDPAFTEGLRWRPVGPNRAGRVSAVAGVPGDPTTYYIGTPDGGLWKTSDAGTTWQPTFDSVHVPSIGAVAVAPSNPRIVYVGTGHNLIGKGVFRSNDAGATWTPAGLPDTKYITALVVDPRDPNIVLVGVGSGGNFGSMVFYNNGPSAARGVYRTTDGGAHWTHALTVDPGSGVVDLVRDPNDARVVYVSFSGAAGGGGGARGAGRGAGRSARRRRQTHRSPCPCNWRHRPSSSPSTAARRGRRSAAADGPRAPTA